MFTTPSWFRALRFLRARPSLTLLALAVSVSSHRLAADSFPVNFTIPAAGQVSAAIYDSSGRQLRSLLHGDPLTAGSYTITWDGLDRHGNPVAPGTYTWKMLRTPGFTATFVGHLGVNPPGNAYDFWLGSHGGAGSVAFDPSGNTYFGSDGTEGVPEMLKLSTANLVTASWASAAGFRTSEDLAPGNTGHLIDLFSDMYVRVFNTTTGAVLYTLDVLPAGWNREAGKDRALDHDVQIDSGASLSGDSTFVVSYPAGNMLRWYNYQTGSLITEVTLAGARGVAVGPSGNTYVISNGAIYKIVYSSGSTTSPVLVVASSSLVNPFKIAYDRANNQLLVAEGAGTATTGHQVKRFDLSGSLLATYGATAGGRAYGVYDTTARNSFRNITDLYADATGGFIVTEGYFTLRRASRWTSAGGFVNERFGGLSYYPGAVMDPDYENRYYIPIGWDDVALVELNNTTHAWTILKVFPNGSSTEGRITTQLDDMVHAGLSSHSTHWKIQKKNGHKYLIGEAGSGVSILRIDETNNVFVPVAVLAKYNPGTFAADPVAAPAPWDAARISLGYSLTNHPEFFSWCDLNDNGVAETSEFLFTNSAVKMVGKFFLDDDWNAYFAYYRSLRGPGTLLRRVNNTSGDPDHPVWNWATQTQLTSLTMPQDFTASEIGEISMLHLFNDPVTDALYGTFSARRDENFGRYGTGFVNDDQGLIRLLKWSSAGTLLWQAGTHHPDTAFDPDLHLPTPPGAFHQPVLILGKINGNLVVQDRLANPGQVWTDDGLYAGNLLDHRAADGLPDMAYKWFLDDAGNDALIQSDCMVGSINKTPAGDVYWMVNGRQAPVVYKITGWDGWQNASGSIVVTTTPAAATFAGTGLQGEYFNNLTLSGSPALTRTDASLWFDDALTGGQITARWGALMPDPAITNPDYSVRWTGFIEAPLGESFNLITETEANSKVRLWLDGQLVIDQWKTGLTPVHGGVSDKRIRHLASKAFNPGQRYAVRLEYARGTGPAEVHLYWESPTMERLHIPAKALRSTDPAADIIIDNTSGASSVTLSGSWATSSASAGYYGTNYLYANGTVPGTRTATYKPTFATSGTYAVYAQWSAGSNRSASTPYTINHAGGSTTVDVNQQINGGAWRYLGTFAFDAGKTGTVVISNETTGIAIADAVRFSRDHPATVNAGQDGFVSWPTATTTLTGSASDTIGSGSLSYAWTLLDGPGTATFGSASAASTTATVSAPGSYNFLLTVTDGTTVSTDVVNVLFLDEIIVDNLDPAYVTKVGSWANGVSGAYYGTNYLHDGNTAKGTKSVTFTLPVPVTRTYTVYAQWSAGSARGTAVPITINHAGGATTVNVNQRLNGGVWNALGTFTFNAGTTGNVVISNNDATGHVIADAIRLTP